MSMLRKAGATALSTTKHRWLWVPAPVRNCALGGDDIERLRIRATRWLLAMTVSNRISLAMTVSPRPVHSPKQRPVIPQDHARGVVAGGAGDAAAGMRAAAAMVEAFQRPAIIGVAQHRPRREQLIEGQRAMKNIAAEQAELALQIERREDLPPHDACRKSRRIAIHGRDHEVGDLVAMVVPRSALGQFRRDVLAEQAGDMPARRAQRVVERRGYQQLDHRLA